jgi:hypothetical protein
MFRLPPKVEKPATEAVLAFQSGRYRESADKYLQAFRKMKAVWADGRYHILHGYTSILREEYFVPSEQDFKELIKIFDNRDEPILYRSEAGFTLGLISWLVGKREEAADYYRETLAVIEQATDQEKKRLVVFNLGKKPAGELIQNNKKTVTDNLNRMLSPTPLTSDFTPSRTLRSNGTFVPSGRVTMFTDPSLQYRLTVGGQTCDYCKLSLQDLGLTKLDRCGRCHMQFYCSKECQGKAWKAGHKTHCRKPDQIEVNDVMKLQGIESDASLNGVLVQVVRPVSEGRWEVRAENQTGRTMSVAADKLVHIRPEK